MVRIRTVSSGSGVLLLALESMTFPPPEVPMVDPESRIPDSPCEAEWAALWSAFRAR